VNFCWQKSNFRTFETKNKRSDEKLYFFRWKMTSPTASSQSMMVSFTFVILAVTVTVQAAKSTMPTTEQPGKFGAPDSISFASLIVCGRSHFPVPIYLIRWTLLLQGETDKFHFFCMCISYPRRIRTTSTQPTNPKSVAYLIPVRRARQRINTVFIT
jgi:hypothetical protein